MPAPTFIITDSFFVKGRGLALLCSWDRDADPAVRARIGDDLELTSTDGEIIRTRIKGIELIQVSPPRPRQAPLGILVPLTFEEGVRLRGASAKVVTEKQDHE